MDRKKDRIDITDNVDFIGQQLADRLKRKIPREISKLVSIPSESVEESQPLQHGSPSYTYANPVEPVSPHKRVTSLTSIIILTCNHLALLKRCVRSIKRFTKAPYELILVDSGSNDGTIEYLMTLDCKIAQTSDQFVFARNCNRGARYAKGDNLLFLNDDTEVTPGWLGKMVRCIESDPRIGSVGPMSERCGNPEQNCTPDDLPNKYIRTNRSLIGFCLLIRRDVWRKLGGMDERFVHYGGEDSDVGIRLMKMRYYQMIAGDAFIHHAVSQSWNNLEEKMNSTSKAQELFVQKWGLKMGCNWVEAGLVKYPDMSMLLTDDIVAPSKYAALLDSLLSQTYQDFEIIIALSANCPADLMQMVEFYENKYPEKITAVRPKAGDSVSPLQTAYERATGTYLVFLHTSASLKPNALGDLADAVAKLNAKKEFNRHPLILWNDSHRSLSSNEVKERKRKRRRSKEHLVLCGRDVIVSNGLPHLDGDGQQLARWADSANQARMARR